MKSGALSQPSRFGRVEVLRRAPARVEREEGYGVIRGASLISRGEALGHGFWIDDAFVAQVSEGLSATGEAGLKARFTHPSLSGDGLGTFLGKWRASGDSPAGKSSADLHFAESAHHTPDGDLADYVMRLAEETPDAFGVSIVFQHDRKAETEFAIEHGAKWATDPYTGAQYLSFEEFKSPDKDNASNLPHARLRTLRAADVVDEPAANPDGLFRRGHEVAEDAEAVVAFALGLTSERPVLVALDIDPSRVRGMVSRFLDRHGLAITDKGEGMSLDTTKPGDGQQSEKPSGNGDASLASGGGNSGGNSGAPAGGTSSASDAGSKPGGNEREEFKRFHSAFGEKAAEYFAAGKSFSEAQAAHIEFLTSENQKLRGASKAANAEESPLSSSASEPAGGGKTGGAIKLASIIKRK